MSPFLPGASTNHFHIPGAGEEELPGQRQRPGTQAGLAAHPGKVGAPCVAGSSDPSTKLPAFLLASPGWEPEQVPPGWSGACSMAGLQLSFWQLV